jgi:AraC-like DNA-binding protein
MVQTREPLSQIAILCGFADQTHMTHIFRARIGAPPNAWRGPRRGGGATATSGRHGIAGPGRACVLARPHDHAQAPHKFP